MNHVAARAWVHDETAGFLMCGKCAFATPSEVLSAARLSQVSGELGAGTQQTTLDAASSFIGMLTDPPTAG